MAAAVGAAVTPTRKTHGVETLNGDMCESVMLPTISVSVCTFPKRKSSQTSYSSVQVHVEHQLGKVLRAAWCVARVEELCKGQAARADSLSLSWAQD